MDRIFKKDMKSITGDFAIIVNEVPVNEVSDPSGKYQMWNDGSTECEVGEYLYGLVRVLKPENILETGCYKGWSSSYMGAALKENKFGHLETLEIEDQHIQTSKIRWHNLDISEFITATKIESLKFQPQVEYELIFLDSEPQIRFQELVRFFPNLKEGGYVGIHDLPNSLCQGNFNPDHPEMKSYPYGDLPEEIKEWLRTDKLRMIHFPSPRGLTFLYKTKEGDYKF